MITVNINQDGEITISAESPGERRIMHETYASEDRSQIVVNNSGDESGAYDSGFRSGLRQAAHAAQQAFVAGKMPEFLQQMGDQLAEESVDPHHNEPEGTGEDDGDGWPSDDYEGLSEASELPLKTGLARPAENSGEPEKERDSESFRDHAGRWIIPDDEFQAIKDAEFQRGVDYISPTTPKRYTHEEIAKIGADGHAQGMKDARKVQFSAVRGAFDRAVAEVEEEVRAEEQLEDIEGLPKTVRTLPDRTSQVLTALFRQLGFEVVR